MPLPPAPTQRAATLSPDAYDAPARHSTSKAARKPSGRSATFEDEGSSKPQALDLSERTGSAGRTDADGGGYDHNTSALLQRPAGKSKAKSAFGPAEYSGSSYDINSNKPAARSAPAPACQAHAVFHKRRMA